MDHRAAQAFQLTLGSVVAGWSSQVSTVETTQGRDVRVMPRRNRNTVAHRRSQRSKAVRSMMKDAADAVTYAAFNPRHDERGAVNPLVVYVVALVSVFAVGVIGMVSSPPGAVARTEVRYESCLDRGGRYVEVVSEGTVTRAECLRRNRRLVQIEGPEFEQMGRNPVMYVEYVHRKWFLAELSDGSTWMVTRCRHEDSRNCWWNAQRRGNGEGRSFLNIHGHYHKAVRGTVVQ